MFKSTDFKAKLNGISAKTLSLGAKQYMRARNEQQVKLLEQFTYPPLKGSRSIRLLEIESGADTDVVSCRLFETDLDQHPMFDALSYTWNLDREFSFTKMDIVEDDKKEERPILCNGRTRLISMNLYHALTEFRRQNMKSPLWADQICINQLDNREKAAQLAIMVDIYRSASCVVIWLGKLNQARSSALDFLEKLPMEIVPGQVVPANEEAAARSMWARFQDSASILTKEVSSHWHWITALLILGRLWFSRAWTLQEMLLATKFRIVMGPREIAPETIKKAVVQAAEFYRTDAWSIQSDMSKMMSSHNSELKARIELLDEREEFLKGKRYSAEEYLKVIRHRQATVKKDMVVAGAALMQDNASVTLDYDSTTLDFYTAFAEKLWAEVGVPSLSFVGGVVCDIEGFPSWTPDLSNPLMPVAMRYCGCPSFEAAVKSRSIPTFSIDGKVLRLEAAQWDVIEGVGENSWSWTRYDDPLNNDKRAIMKTTPSVPAERFGLIFPLVDKLGPTYAPTGERTIDAFWQTLLCGYNQKNSDELSVWRARFFQWFAYVLTSIRGTFREEEDKIKNAWLPNKRSGSPWLIPLIADWPQLEQRVAQFVETHDIPMPVGTVNADEADASETTPEDSHGLSLRQTIAHVMKRILGTDSIEKLDFGKSSLQEFMDLVVKDQFFQPISLFGDLFETIYRGRRMVITKKGYVGAAVEFVRSGDVVCLVSGADVPYILRPVPGKEHTFTLVGEAYVHGIMQGGDDIIQGIQFGPINVV